MSIKTSDGTGQQVYANLAYSKPYIPKDGNPFYNPSTYLNSGLNNYGKRSFMKPNNFIGVKMCRPANMQPNRQQTPKMNRDPIKEGFPILRTPPIPMTYQ